MVFKTLDDYLYAGHMVGSYIDGYFGNAITPPTPPKPEYKDWSDVATKTWGYFLNEGFKWDDLGAATT